MSNTEIENPVLTRPDCGWYNITISKFAMDQAKRIDDMILPHLKPWQRRVVLSQQVSKWYMRPIVWFVKRSAGITIETQYSAPVWSDKDMSVRSETKIIVKKHGRVV